MGFGLAFFLLAAPPAHTLPPRADEVTVRGAEPERLAAFCRAAAGARRTVPDPRALGLPAPGAGRRWVTRGDDLLLVTDAGTVAERRASACRPRR